MKTFREKSSVASVAIIIMIMFQLAEASNETVVILVVFVYSLVLEMVDVKQ